MAPVSLPALMSIFQWSMCGAPHRGNDNPINQFYGVLKHFILDLPWTLVAILPQVEWWATSFGLRIRVWASEHVQPSCLPRALPLVSPSEQQRSWLW
eukprot:3606620-Amphidinium_carterae.1